MDAQFVSGKPVEVTYNTAVAAGAVVVVGNLPAVAHTKGPPFSGGPAIGSISAFGGIYKMTADGAISPGTDVYWDNSAKKVTLTASGNKHFGKLIAGPDGDLGGTGTASDGDAAYVVHCPALIAAAGTFSTAGTITSNSANALDVGPNGTTNPTLQIDGSTASAATGLKVKSAAAAAGLALSVISSGTDENLTIDAKGAGTVTVNATATGAIVLSRGVTLSTTLTTTPGVSTAAAGTTTSDAGALPAGTSSFYPTTAADDTKGVVINAADKVTGRTLYIGNGVSNKILKVYPAAGGTINGGSADAAFSSASGKGVIIKCLSSVSNTWLAW